MKFQKGDKVIPITKSHGGTSFERLKLLMAKAKVDHLVVQVPMDGVGDVVCYPVDGSALSCLVFYESELIHYAKRQVKIEVE